MKTQWMGHEEDDNTSDKNINQRKEGTNTRMWRLHFKYLINCNFITDRHKNKHQKQMKGTKKKC